MNKKTFLEKLKSKTSHLPLDERKKSLQFYEEIIDERLENGEDEEIIIKNLGDVDLIVKDLESNIPISKLIKSKTIDENPLLITIILLLTLPLWIPMLFGVLFTGIAIVFSIFATAFAIFIGLCTLVITGLISVGVLLTVPGIVFTPYTILGILGTIIFLLGAIIISGQFAIFIVKTSFIGIKAIYKSSSNFIREKLLQKGGKDE